VIVSSTFVVDDHAQADGRRYVTETHVDGNGESITLSYLANIDADYDAILAAHAQGISASQSEVTGD